MVSGYVNLKRSGRTMSGLCPFHGEKTPSFHVNAEQGYFHCFGCGAGGDVITFIRKIENLDYIDAVKFLAQRAGMELPEDGRDEAAARIRGRIYEANREAARFSTGAFTVRKGKTLWPISGAGGLPSGPSNTSAWDTLLIPVTLW